MTGHATAQGLSLYLDADLSPAERRRIEDHLHGCSECRQRLDGLRRVVAGLGRLPTAAPPEDLAARVTREIHLRGRRGQWARLLDGMPGPLLSAPPVHLLALVLALAAIVYMFAQGVENRRDRPTRIVLPNADSVVAEPPAAAAPPLRARVSGAEVYLLGGRFELADGVWVETGLAGREPDARLALHAAGDGAAEVPELAELAALGAPLRLAVGERVIEIAVVSDLSPAERQRLMRNGRTVRPRPGRSPGGSA